MDYVNPVAVPTEGTAYSYVKKIRAYLSVAPEVQVSDLVWYTNGVNSFGTGISMMAKNIGTTFGSHYVTAMEDGADLFSYTSASPLSGTTTDTGPFDSGDEAAYIGDIIELQMWVDSSAEHGVKPANTLTLRYMEI